MSKKRTREQKIIARLRRQLTHTANQPTISNPEVALVKEPLMEKPREMIHNNILTFAYDPKLIKRDLVKSIFLSIFFLALIMAIQRFAHL